ncbi:MAG: glycosyltransferase family 2 protein [Xenococcaceae cyanobacterium MO_188.B19]|nr:glycosyltransferase family 2 protein [Xenococcaceae cyanobacterium MO_188.B19]
MSKPTIICLTPVKNEAWILDRFLQCTSLWADHIIIADQNSTDGSREIAEKYSKVILIDNNSSTFNELERQKLLIREARKISGRKLLIALDADEIFTGFENISEWKTMIKAEPGTSFWFQWANILPGIEHYYVPNYHMLFGYMDDGIEHSGNFIHSPRVPVKSRGKKFFFSHIKIMHYQYVDWNRMKSKHRWYQCIERINFPHRSSINIYRQYHHMDVPPIDIKTIPHSWFDTYEAKGIDMTSINIEKLYWWDKEILNFFDKYGVTNFRKEYIWDVDWNQVYKECYEENHNLHFKDPRNRLQKWIHHWLKKSQVNPYKISNKIINKTLRMLNW